MKQYSEALVNLLTRYTNQAVEELEEVRGIIKKVDVKDVKSLEKLNSKIIDADIGESVSRAAEEAYDSIIMMTVTQANVIPFRVVYQQYKESFISHYIERLSEIIEEYLSDSDQITTFVRASLDSIASEIRSIEPEVESGKYKIYHLKARMPLHGHALVAAKDAKEANAILVRDGVLNSSDPKYHHTSFVDESCVIPGVMSDHKGILITLKAN